VRFDAFQCASVRDPEYDYAVFDLGWTGSIPVAGSKGRLGWKLKRGRD
jgi:hypothetical protein